MCFDGGIGETMLIGGLIGGAAGGGVSMYGASQKNAAISRSMAADNTTAGEEIQQQGRIAGVQSLRANQQAEKNRGVIAVSAAERGVGFGGSTAALERNVDQAHGVDQFAIDTNRYGAERRTFGQLTNAELSLEAQTQNPLLAGLQGAISGASTGISIGHSIGGLGGGEGVDPDGVLTTDQEYTGQLRPVRGFT